MAGISLEDLLGGVKAYQQGSQDATKQVLAALDSQVKINQSNVDTLTQAATDSSTVQSAKDAADYETQLSRVKAANAFGTNLKNNTEVVTGLAAAAQDAYQRKDAALKRIQEKESINFLDHPIDYIAAQFTVNRDISEHNIANAQMQAAQERIQAINSNTQSTVITQNAISEPLTAASMEASARLAAVDATVKANQAKITGLNYGVQGIQFALNAKKEELGMLFQAKQAQNSDAQLDLSRQSLELSKKSFEQQQYEFEQRRADKQEQQQLGQSVIDTINLGRKALLGDKAPALDDISGKMALQALKGKGTLSEEMQKYYDAGENARIQGRTVFGATPAQAADTLQKVPAQINPTQGAIKGILTQAARDTNDAIKNAELPGQNKNPIFTGIDKKDKNSISSAYNARAQQILDAAAKEIKPGDTDNPYQVASINQLAANSKTVQSLALYTKVFKPLVDSGVQLSDPKQIMSIVGDAVAKGTITHKEALDVSTIYHVGVAANNAMRNFEGFGLKPQWSYNAKVTTDPRAWHSDEVIDLTKPDDVSRAILKQQASKMQQRLIQQANPATGGQPTDQQMYQFDPSALQFGPKTNYPASKEQMDKADAAYANGWK